MRRGPGGILLLAALLAALPLQAQEQQLILGRVLDDLTGQTVPQAQVALLQGRERIQAVSADESGGFILITSLVGEVTVEVQALGYQTASQSLTLRPEDRLTVTLRISPEAIVLDPLVVTHRSNRGRHLFDARRQEWGRGIFLGPDRIALMDVTHPGQFLKDQHDVRVGWGMGRTSSGGAEVVPNIRTYRGTGCVKYMVDLLPVRPSPLDDGASVWTIYPLDGLRPEDIQAVEVYRYVGEAPPEIRRHAMWDEALCGLVVFWTRAGW